MRFVSDLTARLYRKSVHHRYGLGLGIYLGAAVLTGAGCVGFMRMFEFVFEHRLDARSVGPWCWVTTPLLFLAAVEMIRRLAPCADGAGIPQTIFAARHLNASNFDSMRGLVSFRTMAVKIAALLVGLWAGASTGREGPTVHVAACLFFGIVWALHRVFKLKLDMRSAVVAGGAAGLAAAFNTPLAGVTFAIEELSSDYFSSIKEMVLASIIIAGIAAKTMTGEYVYFGRLGDSGAAPLWAVLAVGLLAGGCGAFFSSLLVVGKKKLSSLGGPARVAFVAACAWIVLFLAAGTALHGIAGPGNAAARNYVAGAPLDSPVGFTLGKMAATLLTYWSGIAGGIFAPCLAMGAAIGSWAAAWIHAPLAACAMMGMAAFLAGAIQAPITSFVIIYEMTGRHDALLPIMLAALIGTMTARVFRAKHLYQALAGAYEPMLPPGSPRSSH